MKIVPTAEQECIIRSDATRILVEANAGAAKTTTAALRIKLLIEKGVDPSKILAFSFSEPGVQAYKNAFRRIGISESAVRVGTFDEFCAARLKKFDGVAPTNFNRAQEVKPYILEAIKTARTIADQKFPDKFSIQGSGLLAVDSLLKDFSYLKGTLSIQRYGEHFSYNPNTADELGCDYTTLSVFREYERVRTGFVPPDSWGVKFRYTGDATYDMACYLMSDEPPWGWENNPLNLDLEAIFLDEMHDCGWAMFTTIRQLLELNPKTLFLGVGDRDQVIHGQHGADSYFMGPSLEIELGEITRYPLSLTHRFGSGVAKPMALFAAKQYQSSSSMKGTRVYLRSYSESAENAGMIVDFISRFSQESRSSGEEFAVLLRHPGASVELEHGLISKGISYKTVGFKTFLQRPEISFIRMLLSIATDHKTYFMPRTLLEAKRAVWQFLGANLPTPNTIEETEYIIEKTSELNFKTYIFSALLDQADSNIAESLHAAMQIAKSDAPKDVTGFVKALNFSIMARKAFVSQQDVEEAICSIESFSEVAKRYSKISDVLSAMNIIDSQQKKSRSVGRQITLSTIEESKGLEFRDVFIPDCNKNSFDGAGQDERNLFYVAATRARDNLVISYKKDAGSSYLMHFQ